MFSYYLCNDGETIYRIEFSLKQKDKKKYVSLLENYLNELVYVEETEIKKLIEDSKIKKENKEDFSIEKYMIFLRRSTVIDVNKIEEYLPFVVTLKIKKFFLPRFWTISVLIKLLSEDLKCFGDSNIGKIAHLLGYSEYIDFNLINSVFFDEAGNLFPERFYDYHSLIELLRSLEVTITEKYSRSLLINFWQGDEAERELAEGIVLDSSANRKALKNLNFQLILANKR